MPFRETGRMEERIRMFLEYESGNWSVSEMCRRYGVCRDTFYEWRKRKRPASGVVWDRSLRRCVLAPVVRLRAGDRGTAAISVYGTAQDSGGA